ncbi:L-seryl-tRNA(Sec) selenium transferase [Nakamurella aerolata]|uniref:L-seryl-tRNA(Sec) selenium transferase n=1 Tax=Nakamurella aerolata TaxID=1656892 RepID=A0A849A6Q0_9ACTN|nr:L-seryl-tRNA(Sec) selenium transferase [Nakamurella aerolata]
MSSSADPRREIPRTDQLLAHPQLRAAAADLGADAVRQLVHAAQQSARQGRLAPGAVTDAVLSAAGEAMANKASRPGGLTPVLNATGVVVHTNLGRAPLSAAATAALTTAAGYVDVELDLDTGTRSGRGTAARQALLHACPAAAAALVVNNGAAALLLATTALAAGREVVVSRGELIEIGAGFRLPDLIESTGARLREVGTANRTHPRDYAAAIGPDTGCLLKIHPSNFRVNGFTAEATIADLRPLATERGVPLIADLGSGLLRPDPLLPDEPDADTALTAGADLVIASGDKLLGGPQAGLLLGRADLIDRLAHHPLARAVRADKLALAALTATLTDGAGTPTWQALHADPEVLRRRTEALAKAVGAPVVPHDGRVGGGGAPGVPLAGWAVQLPPAAAPALRTAQPAVLPRVHHGRCLIDLRCIPAADDARLLAAVRSAVAAAGHPVAEAGLPVVAADSGSTAPAEA